MFCPKCGNQLPDGAMFCSSCGSPINIQPVAPAEPVAPVAVTPAFIPAEQVAPVVAPTFTPSEPVASMASFPNNTGVQPKKSKAPLFIGLGIGALVIAIVAIVLVLVLGDDDKDNKKPASATEQSTTSKTENETTTEEVATKENTTENTTEEPTTPKKEEDTTVNTSNNVKLTAAVNLATDLMTMLKSSDFTKLGDYLIPGMAKYIEENDLSVEEFGSFLALAFYDDNLTNFLNYEVKTSSAEECDDTFFNEEEVDDFLKNYPEYKKPTAFAKVEVELSYKEQKSSIYLHFAYIDDKCYFYTIDDSNYDIAFDGEDESESETDTDTDTSKVSEMLSSNMKIVKHPNVTGKTYQGEGFELTVPADWTETTAPLVSYTAANGNANFNITVEDKTLLSYYSHEELLALYYDTYKNMDFKDLEIGKLQATNTNGYYIEYEYLGMKGLQFLYPNADNTEMYIVTITSLEPDSDEYSIAEASAASLKLK